MKEGIRSAVLSVAAAWFVLFPYAGIAIAENCPGTFTASVFAGRTGFDGSLDYFDDTFRGFAIGYDIDPKLSAELSYSYLRTEEDKVPGDEVNAAVSIIRAEALYHLPKLKSEFTIVPFLAAGPGLFVFNSDREGSSADTDFAFDYGLGIKWFFVPNFAVRADIRHAIGFKNINDSYNVLLYFFGLTYERTAVKKAPEPVEEPAPVKEITPAPTADSDGDGVPDETDKCPDTPAGSVVNKDGCPKDSDDDGVPDYLDKCPDTPKGTKVDANGCPPPEKAKITEQGTYDFGKIYFDFNKTTIGPNSRPVLENVVEYLEKNPQVKMEIQGHADIIGPEGYNLKLSEARARSVKKYLVSEGIASERLTIKGFGVSRPIASNKDKDGRAKNRRIEFMPIQ